MTMTSRIMIERLKKVEGKKKIRAFVNIEIDGIIIRDIRLMQEDDEAYWLGFPQKKGKDKDGEEKYWDIVSATSEVKKQILKIVLEAYNQ